MVAPEEKTTTVRSGGTPEELMACIVSGIDVETGAVLSTETQGAG